MKKIFLFLFFFFFLSSSIFAQDSSRYEELSRQIKELEQKLEETKAREKTLSSQITYMNNQIKLTTLKINETQVRISQLEEEIENLSAKIDRLEGSLEHLSTVLLARIIETYKRGNTPSFYLIFSSGNFSDFLIRLKYISIVQAHDKQLMIQMQETKDNYMDQKNLREEKKKEEERLKRQLESQKATLAQQTKDKEALLEITRNDEKRYQELLAAARAEQSALESTMQQALALLKNGSPIEEGAQIALIGNSGYPYCSTGAHLHFEIRRNGNPENPASFLKDIGIRDTCSSSQSTNCFESDVQHFTPSGSWNWPISEPRITQEYGMSYWARLGWYNGGPHTGIDMTSTSNIIRAPKKGTLYKGTTSCRGVGMNYVAIDHGDGLISWYWHVQ